MHVFVDRPEVIALMADFTEDLKTILREDLLNTLRAAPKHKAVKKRPKRTVRAPAGAAHSLGLAAKLNPSDPQAPPDWAHP